MSCPANYNDHPLSDTGLAAPIGSTLLFFYENGHRLDGFSWPRDSGEAAPLLARALAEALEAS